MTSRVPKNNSPTAFARASTQRRKKLIPTTRGNTNREAALENRKIPTLGQLNAALCNSAPPPQPRFMIYRDVFYFMFECLDPAASFA
jgi:hypothetical protein